jgi:hypothetical protein
MVKSGECGGFSNKERVALWDGIGYLVQIEKFLSENAVVER